MMKILKKFSFKKKKTEKPNLDELASKEALPENRGEAPNPEKEKPWIGVDLDGTLAYYNGWQGLDHIGQPVPVMLARVKHWIKQGYTVKIFTARASAGDAGINPVKAWLLEQNLPELEVTNQKNFAMIELWDDRAIQVVANTGRPFLSPSIFGRPAAPILPNEDGNKTFYLLQKPKNTNQDSKKTNENSN